MNPIRLYRSMLAIVALLCHIGDAAAQATRAPVPATTPPNVILIITDDQGYGDVHAHGNSILETPNLDRLAAESVRLTQFHVDPTCSPTRAALLTGRYSTKGGVWHTIGGRSLLRRDMTTMADVFGHNGYRTGIFGKWHLGDGYPFRPQDRGFQQVLVHGGGGVGQTPDYWGNDYFDDHYQQDGIWRPVQGYATDAFFDAATRFVAADRGRPFFLYLATNAPHAPWNVPQSYAQGYLDKGVDAEMAKFYGMITNLDENLGRLLHRLDQLGLRENTIVIFTTDNGTAGRGFNAGMRGRKGSEYQGGHRVPFFIRYPGQAVPAGRTIDRLTAHIDVLPTLIDLAGLRLPHPTLFDGASLVPLLRGDGSWPDRTLFVHSQRVQQPEKWRRSSVMTDEWRLVNGGELYRIRTDSAEERNVASAFPSVVERLREAYERWWKDLEPYMSSPSRYVLGSDAQNPVGLTAHDWHAPDGQIPWDQTVVRRPDFSGNGFWSVHVSRPGTYEIVLRERPEPARFPIRAKRARIEIGGSEHAKEVTPGSPEVRFQVRLEEGESELQTWFETASSSRGAFYVDIRRL